MINLAVQKYKAQINIELVDSLSLFIGAWFSSDGMRQNLKRNGLGSMRGSKK